MNTRACTHANACMQAPSCAYIYFARTHPHVHAHSHSCSLLCAPTCALTKRLLHTRVCTLTDAHTYNHLRACAPNRVYTYTFLARTNSRTHTYTRILARTHTFMRVPHMRALTDSHVCRLSRTRTCSRVHRRTFVPAHTIACTLILVCAYTYAAVYPYTRAHKPAPWCRKT